MHFDDRLATVLQHRAAGERAARVQFRQLLDLLGEPGADGDPALTRAAFRRLDALGLLIPLIQRERLAGESSPRIRNPRLLAWFAAAEPRVALAALSRAALSEAQWLALIPELPIRARGLLRHRRNLPRGARDLLDRLGVRDRVLPEPAIAVAAVDSGPAEDAVNRPVLELGDGRDDDYLVAEPAALERASPDQTPAPGETGDLGALLRRIEAFQRLRGGARPNLEDMEAAFTANAAPDPAAPRLPLGDAVEGLSVPGPLAGFLFTTDDSGRLDWAEGAAAPLAVGSLLVEAGAADPMARAFARRQPVTGIARQVAGADAIAGDWIVDAAPRFSRAGRFAGYVGRFRRPAPAPVDTRALREADRVRQLLHELRTPVTAIQGFAEVIQQQTVGPVPHEYRALAAGIAGDAARMLAGFAEIERLVRLEAGTQELPEGTSDFVFIARRQIAQLQTVLSPRVSRIEARFGIESAVVALASESAETIAWRFLGTLAATIAAGERMALTLEGQDGQLRMAAHLPAALAQASDVFAGDIHPVGGALSVGLLGAGFALRLARAEARAVGGDLFRESAGAMVLTLPLGESSEARERRPTGTARGIARPSAPRQQAGPGVGPAARMGRARLAQMPDAR